MPKRTEGKLTKRELQALLALWDSKGGTPYALGFDKSILDQLVSYGFAECRARITVGKSKRFYSLSEKGKHECLLTGKRFVPTIGP